MREMDGVSYGGAQCVPPDDFVPYDARFPVYDEGPFAGVQQKYLSYFGPMDCSDDAPRCLTAPGQCSKMEGRARKGGKGENQSRSAMGVHSILLNIWT